MCLLIHVDRNTIVIGSEKNQKYHNRIKAGNHRIWDRNQLVSHKLCERFFIQCEICKYFICFGDCFADYVLSHTRTAVESGYDNKVYALYDDFEDYS